MKAKRRKKGRGAGPQARLLNANLALLRAKDPALAKLIAQPLQGRLLRTERGGGGDATNLFLSRPEGYEAAWYDGAPADGVRELRERADLKGASVLFVVGMGLGHELVALATDPDARLHRIYVVEPDIDVLRVAFRVTKLAAVLKRPHVEFLVGPHLNELAARLDGIWRDGSMLRFCQAACVAMPAGAARFHPQWAPAAEQVVRDSAAQGAHNVGNSPMDVLMGLEQTLRNLPLATRSPGMGGLTGALAGRPAVIACAGPSLAKQLGKLAEVQDEVVVICPDTSLRALKGSGIEPHLIASRERTPFMTAHFEGLQLERSRLAGLTLLHPGVFEMFGGEAVPIARRVGHFMWLWPSQPVLDFSGASGNMAYALAVAMGCDPILLIGQDLAFGADGRTHVHETALGERQTRYVEGDKFEIPGYGGGTALTSAMWLGLLQHLQHAVVRNSGRTLNCTEGGARIEGTSERPFADALAGLRRPPAGAPTPRQVLDAKLAPRAPERALAEARRLHGLLGSARGELSAIIERCGEAAQAAAQLGGQPLPAHLAELPPDVGAVSSQPPVAQLLALRNAILRSPGFDSVVMPCAQPVLVPWEIALYSRQRQAADGLELCGLILPDFERWFRDTQTLAAGALELLAWGEHSLSEAHPELPPPSAALPAESVTDIWLRTNARPEDQWSDPSKEGLVG